MSPAPLPHETAPVNGTLDAALNALRAAGAAQRDPVGWYHIERLAARTAAQSGHAQALLQDKLMQAIDTLQIRLDKAAATDDGKASQTGTAPASPLADLLREMGHTGLAQPPASQAASPKMTGHWRPESPRVRQFRQQLSRISVQKQVNQAIAQAPQNAGPINSQMLVLRALAVMRDASPDYLNRFMTYLDTLLCLEEAGKTRLAPKKTPAKTLKK